MINDLYGIYWANRGLQVLAPQRALPENQARRYLYESIGLEPWLGSEKAGVPKKPLGDHYLQLTEKGLTRELGYVGTYGEVLDWVAQIYDATRPTPDAPGDGKIKAQLVKIARARAAFRHPALDAEGNRAMRLEQIVGWRENIYAGKAEWYQLRYGPYFIAMNTTKDKIFAYQAPVNARNLVAKQDVKTGQVLKIGPNSTIVLYVP